VQRFAGSEAPANPNPVTCDGDYRRLLDSGFSIVGPSAHDPAPESSRKRFELRVMTAAMIVKVLESIDAAP
jgi:hypothetical protein